MRLMGRLQRLLVTTILHILPSVLLSETLRARKRSLAIDRALKKDGVLRLLQYNVLPLGSTNTIRDLIEVLKNHDNRTSLSRYERLGYLRYIHLVVNESVKQLLEVAGHNATTGNEMKSNDEHYDNLLHLTRQHQPESDLLTKQNGRTIEALWETPSIKSAFETHCMSSWSKSASYFLDNILRLTAPNYVPSDTDIRHSQSFHGNAAKLRFDLPAMSLNFLDVKPQCERRKWIHQLDNVPVILYVADLCTYDEVLSGTNTLDFMMKLFENIVNREQWREATFVILLCGVGEFEKKLERLDFGEYFADYNKAVCDGSDIERAEQYLVKKFVNANGRAWVRVAFADLDDPGSIETIGNAVRDRLRGYAA